MAGHIGVYKSVGINTYGLSQRSYTWALEVGQHDFSEIELAEPKLIWAHISTRLNHCPFDPLPYRKAWLDGWKMARSAKYPHHNKGTVPHNKKVCQ